MSDLTRTRFTQWSGAQRRVWATLPNAIHLDAYSPGAAPAHLLDRYGLRGKKILLTVGRMSARERYKGFDQILECLPHLSREDLDIAYVAAGDGDDRGRLMEKTRQLGLQDRVVFPGFVAEEEKQDHFRLADAFVMPGWGEGFGFVYLEALACGIPCLGSRIDGSREALRGGQLGILVDPRDPREVRNGLLRVLSMPRGTVLPGLEYFAYPRFQERVHAFFEAAAG